MYLRNRTSKRERTLDHEERGRESSAANAACGGPWWKRSLGDKSGFTLIEVLVTIMVLAIILSIVGVNYARGRRTFSLKSGVEEVEAALRRCYNIALQEGVDVYVVFSDATGDRPDTYAIYRGIGEREADTPTETPNAGTTHITDGAGHYWFKIAGGSVRIEETVELKFERSGTVVKVSPVTEGDGMSVTIRYGDETRTISISEAGEVTSS